MFADEICPNGGGNPRPRWLHPGDQPGWGHTILLGKERAELTGYPLAHFVPEQNKPTFLAHVRQCCEGHREAITELSLIAEDGQLRIVQLHSIPLVSPGEEGTFCKTAIANLPGPRKWSSASGNTMLRLPKGKSLYNCKETWR